MVESVGFWVHEEVRVVWRWWFFGEVKVLPTPHSKKHNEVEMSMYPLSHPSLPPPFPIPTITFSPPRHRSPL